MISHMSPQVHAAFALSDALWSAAIARLPIGSEDEWLAASQDDRMLFFKWAAAEQEAINLTPLSF